MKLKFTFRVLMLVTVAITAVSMEALAQNTPIREWDFNRTAYAVGRCQDQGSLINTGVELGDWTKENVSMPIQEAYWTEDSILSYRDVTKSSWFAFTAYEVKDHVIQGNDPKRLNDPWPMFGSMLDNIVINAPVGAFGFCNEADPNQTDIDQQERFLILKKGASFKLTGLQIGDYIIIKMDRTGAVTANLHITNAKDALGNNIDPNDNYGIGGCQWFDEGGKKYWKGEYVFIATSTDMTFSFVGDDNGQTLKLYNIRQFRNPATYPSENSIVCARHYGQTFYYDYRDLTNNDENPSSKTGNYELHFRGKAEKTFVVDVVKSGTLSFTTDDFTKINDYKWKLKSKPGEWGIFKVRMASKDHSGKYYTDYADRICSQTVLRKATYPCTWDFTDLQTYFDEYAWKENPVNLENQDGDLAFWKLGGTWGAEHTFNFQMGVDKYGENAGHHAQYVNGGELHIADHAFPELEGLGVSAFAWGGHLYNDLLKISKDGIELSSDATKPFKFTIPEIGGDSEAAAVYVRVKKNESGFVAKAQVGSNAVSNMELVGEDGDECVYRTSQITTNDWVTLQLTGCTVKKIAVTKDFKSVNSYGYSTESRTRAIDHNLTPYFTAGKVKAYSVSDVDYDNSKIVLSEVDKILPAASNNGDAGLGVILYNKEKTSLEGFGLFVADIHDKDNNDLKLSAESNKLCANLTQNNSIGANPGEYTNYLLNAKGTNPVNGKTVEGIAFYRASKTAKLGPNKAYLPILTSAVQPSTGNLGGAKMQIVFADPDDAEDDATVTAVKEIEVSNAAEENTCYTLSGIKIDRPTKSGIYIKNGKKIIIK